MTDLSSVDQTRTSDVTETDRPIQTRTIGDLVEEAGWLRNKTHGLTEDVDQLHDRAGSVHHRAIEAQLTERAHQLTAKGAEQLLAVLSDAGFSWRDIARMTGVSVPAVRRWRQGDSPTPEHLYFIARIAAVLEIIERDHMVSNVGSWLEVPLFPPCPYSGIDLITSGHFDELLDLAGYHVAPEDVLDRVNPGWRSSLDSGFEVFEAADGERGIRPIRAATD